MLNNVVLQECTISAVHFDNIVFIVFQGELLFVLFQWQNSWMMFTSHRNILFINTSKIFVRTYAHDHLEINHRRCIALSG